ncbi:MAG: phosphotransferase [Mycoplasma sp.]|nr:phosphotransferase [Mycoplasma sp.]
MKKINIGYTNNSFENDGYFYQKKNKNGLNHKTNYSVLSNFDFVPKLISDNEFDSTWEWIDGKSLDNPTKEDLIKLVNILKILHNSNVQFSKSNIRRRIMVYRQILKEKNIRIDIIDDFYQKINNILKNIDTSKPIHGDLYRTNIIKRNSDGKLFIVDWEYSHMGDIHYELAYIIEAYEFDRETEIFFLKEYGNYDPYILLKHKILVNYITVLWLYSQNEMPFSPNKILEKLRIMYKEINEK